jgi:hypothetical protein
LFYELRAHINVYVVTYFVLAGGSSFLCERYGEPHAAAPGTDCDIELLTT